MTCHLLADRDQLREARASPLRMLQRRFGRSRYRLPHCLGLQPWQLSRVSHVPSIAPWAVKYPSYAIIPVSDWISAFMAWLKTNFTWLTRGITDILNVPLQWAINLLAKGWKSGYGPDAFEFPRLSWVGICAAFALAGNAFGGWRIAALAAGCMTYIALFGQWESAMLTLALIAISVPLCVVVGLALGVLAFRKPGSIARSSSRCSI